MLPKITIAAIGARVFLFIYPQLSQCISELAAQDGEQAASDCGGPAAGKLEPFLTKLAEALEKMRRIEGRVATDEDLKLSDVLRYHMRDTSAAKDLLYRRLRCESYLIIDRVSNWEGDLLCMSTN